MSSFSALKTKRQARQGPSFASTFGAPPAEREPNLPHASVESVVAGRSPLPSEVTKPYTYDEGVYGELPEYLEIRVSEERGRGIYVKVGKTVKAGTSLIKVKPHAYSLSTPNLDAHCASCLLNPQSSISPAYQVTQLRRCTGCRAVSYCSKECQIQDWKEHKEECRALKALRGAGEEDHGMPGEAVRALGRLVWGRKRVGGDSAWWKEVELMQSNIERLNPQQHEPLSLLGFALCRYLGISPQDSPREETVRKLADLGFASIRDLTNLLSRFQTNSFSLTTPDLTNVGVAVSPLAALISHSCMPNAVVVFPTGLGRRGMLEVVALQELKSGEEVLTSYLDIALPYAQRQKELKERYLFECECELCIRENNPGWVDPRAAVRCRKEGCKGRMRLPEPGNNQVTCTTCGSKVSMDGLALREYIKLATEALQKAEALQFSQPDKAQYLLTSVLRYLSRLAFSSYPLHSILQLLQQLFITAFSSLPPTDPQRDALLQDAASCAVLVLSGMEDLYPAGHPSKGVQYVTMAKLLMAETANPSSPGRSVLPPDFAVPLPTALPRLRIALDLLSKATQALPLGFGKGGGIVGRDVSLLAQGLEREIRMWTALGSRRAIG